MENKSYNTIEASRILSEINAAKKHANTKSLTLLIGVIVFIALTWSVFQGLTSSESSNGVAAFFLILFIAVYAITALGVIVTSIMTLTTEQYAKVAKVSIPTEDGSLINYEKIAELEYKEFAEKVEAATEESLLEDYRKQIYLASAIVKLKNKFFNIGIVMAGIMFLCTIIIIIMNNVVNWGN